MTAAGQSYFDGPCAGQHPSGQSWGAWRTSVFANNTYCNTQYNNYDAAKCNQFSGYFTKYIKGVWYNQLQPLTVGQLYSYSNPCQNSSSMSSSGSAADYAYSKTFCENLMYANGEKVPADKRPFCCGGTGPNVYEYSAVNNALESAQAALAALANKYSSENRSKIILVVGVVVAVLILIIGVFLR